jgi:extracellular factor (EF) 3-hydroxypalmitic acid methyl ester biosynthesis protein
MIKEQLIVGLVHTNGTPINVELSGHTRYSFQIRIPNVPPNISTTIVERFMIELDKKEIELGRCQLLPFGDSHSTEFTVLLLDHIVDVMDLISTKKLKAYDTGLLNLKLILNHKDKITHKFKDYTANLTFELNVYKQLFDDLDHKYVNEPRNVKEHLQQMTFEREYQSFMGFMDSKMRELEEQTLNFSKEKNGAHGFFFRKQVWDFILYSAFMARTNLKPLGYAGDYEMMKMIYDNEILGQTTFSRLINSYVMKIPASQAVRNRQKMIANELYKSMSNHGDSEFRALSVACGPAEEIKEAFLNMKTAEKVHFTLLDQDTEALRAAKNTVQQLELAKGWSIDVRYINDSVRSMLRIQDLASEWGTYDFIYSMGLFDYLTPPVARAVLSRLYTMLSPGGRLLIGNFHFKNPDRKFMEYWLDWVLYHRTDEEMLGLADSLDGKSRIFFEGTGSQMFLEVTSPNI